MEDWIGLRRVAWPFVDSVWRPCRIARGEIIDRDACDVVYVKWEKKRYPLLFY